jgi:putative component of membrane protein insertase Oxa1/YidC/SpoIIIJ protein YidD
MPFLGMKSAFLFLCFVMVFSTADSMPGYEDPWGKDSDLVEPPASRIPPMPSGKSGLFVKMAEKVIWVHTDIISPVDGPRSHFRPTSSRYMLLAMKRHGFVKGFLMGCDRLLRENKDPWVYRTCTIDGIEYKWDPTYKTSP